MKGNQRLSLLAFEVSRYSGPQFFLTREVTVLPFFIYCGTASGSHLRARGVEKLLPANYSIFSTLQKCFWCWYQTVPLSNLVFHSMFVTLGLGKPLASASLLPAKGGGGKWSRKPEFGSTRRSCFLPVLLAEGKELFVHVMWGRSWEPFSNFFLDLKEKIMKPGLFFLVPVT